MNCYERSLLHHSTRLGHDFPVVTKVDSATWQANRKLSGRTRVSVESDRIWDTKMLLIIVPVRDIS